MGSVRSRVQHRGKMYDAPVNDGDNGCVFCDYAGPSEILFQIEDESPEEAGVFVIEPVRPVAPGHVLVIPRRHVTDFAEEPGTTALVCDTAAFWWRTFGAGPANLITSKGREASQSIEHLHVHVVPRHGEDKLALPWSSPDFGRLSAALDTFQDHGDYEVVIVAARDLVRRWTC